MTLKYRADIDGLRAISVLAVTLFHWKVGTGGYVGVDCFFVISGFLISRIIHSGVADGSYSIIDFYERRIRRIIPALYAYIVVATAASVAVFLPTDQGAIFRSAIATMFFGSNILFWSESGYFAAEAVTRPLLHTWSLGVEEQFYLLFPVALALLARRGTRVTVAGLALLAAASFIANVVIVEQSQASAFFLSPPRMWELLAGGLIAVAPVAPPRSPILRTLLAAAGLASIIVASSVFNSKTLFPGTAAALPVLGAVLLIWTGGPGSGATVVHRLLTCRPMVFVGKISFSLYLWHWGLWVFARRLDPAFGGLWRIPLFALLIALSYASYRYLEQPVRQGKIFATRRSVFRAFALSTALLLSAGVSGVVNNGFAGPSLRAAEQYLTASRTEYPRRPECTQIDRLTIDRNGICTFGAAGTQPSALVWGDSHAFALLPALDVAAREQGRSFYYVSGCIPTDGTLWRSNDAGSKCRSFGRGLVDFVAANRLDTVILADRWSLDTRSTRFGDTDPDVRSEQGRLADDDALRAAFTAAYLRLLRQFDAMGVDVVLIDQAPEYGVHVARTLSEQALWWAKPSAAWVTTRETYLAANRNYETILAGLEGKVPFRRVRLGDRLCPDEHCLTELNGRSLYLDANHLSVDGAMYVAPLLTEAFKGR